MAVNAVTIKAIRDEMERVAAGGDIDRANVVRFLTLATQQLEDWRDAYYECDLRWGCCLMLGSGP